MTRDTKKVKAPTGAYSVVIGLNPNEEAPEVYETPGIRDQSRHLPPGTSFALPQADAVRVGDRAASFLEGELNGNGYSVNSHYEPADNNGLGYAVVTITPPRAMPRDTTLQEVQEALGLLKGQVKSMNDA